jgi:hypothetical protein
VTFDCKKGRKGDGEALGMLYAHRRKGVPEVVSGLRARKKILPPYFII